MSNQREIEEAMEKILDKKISEQRRANLLGGLIALALFVLVYFACMVWL